MPIISDTKSFLSTKNILNILMSIETKFPFKKNLKFKNQVLDFEVRFTLSIPTFKRKKKQNKQMFKLGKSLMDIDTFSVNIFFH